MYAAAKNEQRRTFDEIVDINFSIVVACANPFTIESLLPWLLVSSLADLSSYAIAKGLDQP